MPWRRAGLLLVVVVMTAGMVGSTMVRDFARKMMFPGGPVPFPRGTAVEYRAGDGTRLEGAWVRSGNPDARVVVYFHGNAESAAQNIPFAQGLASEGLDVFLAEYRGYGGLSGVPSEEGLYEDAEAAVAHIYGAGTRRDRLVLCGRSLGTGVASELAHRGHGSSLVLISPYTSMVDMGRRMVGSLAAMLVADRFDTAAKIPAIEVPVLVIHGTADEVIPFTMGETIHSLAKRSTFVPQDGFGHNDLVDLPATIARSLRP